MGNVKYCLTEAFGTENKLMLDSAELARRLRKAMDEHIPPISGSELALACGVTPQAVSQSWRKSGRISKGHLEKIAAVTGQPIDYYVRLRTQLDTKVTHRKERRKNPQLSEEIIDNKGFLFVFRAWQDTGANGREFLIDAANTALKIYGRARTRKSA